MHPGSLALVLALLTAPLAAQAQPPAGKTARVGPEFYDHVVPYATRPDVRFYVEAARESGGPVLELGCGTGRVLVPTARSGTEIVGLDASVGMLEVCRRRLRTEPPEVRGRASLQRADMRNFDLGRTFRLVTIPFRPFQHLLTIEDQLACLAAIRRHLAADCRLVFDVFNPSIHNLAEPPDGAETNEEPPFTLPDGRTVVRRHRMLDRDLIRQVNTGELVYYVTHPDGRQERLVHPFQMRCVFRFEAEHLLARAGFMVDQVYSDFDRSPYGSRYPGELIFVARRQVTRT
ncbi:MAG: class I SAM-dependent methyltransferase [Candidatus Rokuibacteriota bacterium]